MKNRTHILDAQGNPIRQDQDRVEDLNLPPGLQALVETRLNDAVDRLREHNQIDIKELAQDHSRKWRIVSIASWVITVVFAIWAPIQIPGWIKQYVQDHMTKPEMERIADEAIHTKMGDYVNQKIEPIQRTTEQLMTDTAFLTNQLAEVSQTLDDANENYSRLSQNLLSLRQFFDSRRGDRRAYDALRKSSVDSGADLTTSLLRDIEEYYRDFKNETKGKPAGQWGREVISVQTMAYNRSPAEIIYKQLADADHYQREAEVNDTARRIAEAKTAFAKAEEETDGFTEALLEHASLLLSDKQPAEAIERIRKAKPYLAEKFPEAITNNPAFAPLKDDENFKKLLESGQLRTKNSTVP